MTYVHFSKVVPSLCIAAGCTVATVIFLTSLPPASESPGQSAFFLDGRRQVVALWRLTDSLFPSRHPLAAVPALRPPDEAFPSVTSCIDHAKMPTTASAALEAPGFVV